MSKFLRKYKTWILAVGGSLLMIAWLFPQAVQQFGGLSLTSTVARYEGGKLTVQDYNDAQAELGALQGISPVLLTAMGLSDGQSLTQNAVDHWLLLTKEAQRGGFVGGAQDGRALVEDLATQVFNREQMMAQMRGETPPDLALVRQVLDNNRRSAGGGRPEKWIDTTLAKAGGVMRMMNAGRSLGTIISTQEATLFAWELFDAAVTDIALVPASAVAGELAAPDQARLAAFFEAHKNSRPGESGEGNEMGFGYKRDGAVRVEWITIAREAVTNAMEADPIEVNKFWRQNKASFGENFSEARAAVEQQFKRDQAEKRLEAVRNAIDRQKIKLYGGLESEGRYKKIPADWQKRMPSMDALLEPARAALDLPAAAGMIFATPADSIFRNQAELRQLPGVGMAGGRVGDASFVPFAQVASEVRELGFANSLHGGQVGVVMGPVRDMMGQNEYYFRVVEVRPEGPPASVDEVLDQVKRDVADADGFELLKKQQDAYKERLVNKGIGDLLTIPGVRSAMDVVVRRDSMASNDPNTPFTLTEADSEAVRKAVTGLVENWDPKADVSALSAAERSVAVADAKARGLVLAMVKARRPLTKEKLDASQNEVLGYAFQKLTGPATGQDPFSFEALRKRLNYRAANESSEPAPAEEPKSDGAATPAGAG